MGEVDVRDSVDRVLAVLRDARRSERTVRCHQAVLDRFTTFLAGRGLDTVSDPVCIEFIADQTGVKLGSLREPVKNRAAQAVRRPVVLMADALAGRAIDVDQSVLPVKDFCPLGFRPLRDEYLASCRGRGNAEATVVAKDKVASRFLGYLIEVGIDDLAALSVRDVAGFFLHQRGLRRKTIAAMRSCLADFLSFLASSGRTPCSLADRLPPHRHVRHESEPHLWTAEEIRKVLSVINRQSVAGKRDYAMILATARLGLRISDLRQLELGDLDWRGEEDHDRPAQDGPAAQPAAARRRRLGDHRLRPRRPTRDGLSEGVRQAPSPLRRVWERLVGRLPTVTPRCQSGDHVPTGRALRNALPSRRACCRDDRQRRADTGGVGRIGTRLERYDPGLLPPLRHRTAPLLRAGRRRRPRRGRCG